MSGGRHRARSAGHVERVEPVPDAAAVELPEFLLRQADAEPDSAKRVGLRTLVDQWRGPTPPVQVPDVWDTMVSAAREYRGAPGYRERWDMP